MQQQAPSRRTFAATVTPLLPGPDGDGAGLDRDAVAPLTDFMADAGLDGMLVLGTTGEGVLFDAAERMEILETFVAAAGARLEVIAHCGAQSTRDTVALARHAASAGAGGVAVIGPPYFAFDEGSLLDHFAAAATACDPLPFYVYEFAARSGYSVPPRVVEELRRRAGNVVGLKVSDATWPEVEPYLALGLRVFVGNEGLIARGAAAGAAGSVSGLAAALPELVVDAVGSGDQAASDRCRTVRDEIQRFPFHSALKAILAARGVPIQDAVRKPLRRLAEPDREELRRLIPSWLAGLPAPSRR